MAKVHIVRDSKTQDALDVEGNVSLNYESDEGYCRLDFVAHNEGVTVTTWGINPETLFELFEELTK